jgi:hypothetical protein
LLAKGCGVQPGFGGIFSHRQCRVCIGPRRDSEFELLWERHCIRVSACAAFEPHPHNDVLTIFVHDDRMLTMRFDVVSLRVYRRTTTRPRGRYVFKRPKGLAYAQRSLGLMYAVGRGVPLNEHEAKKRKVDREGFPLAS